MDYAKASIFYQKGYYYIVLESSGFQLVLGKPSKGQEKLRLEIKKPKMAGRCQLLRRTTGSTQSVIKRQFQVKELDKLKIVQHDFGNKPWNQIRSSKDIDGVNPKKVRLCWKLNKDTDVVDEKGNIV